MYISYFKSFFFYFLFFKGETDETRRYGYWNVFSGSTGFDSFLKFKFQNLFSLTWVILSIKLMFYCV